MREQSFRDMPSTATEAEPRRKTILLLSKRISTLVVATVFVEN